MIEINNHIKQYNEYKSKSIHIGEHFLIMIRSIIPNNILRIIFEMICIFSYSPECSINLLHGTKFDFPDTHDEL